MPGAAAALLQQRRRNGGRHISFSYTTGAQTSSYAVSDNIDLFSRNVRHTDHVAKGNRQTGAVSIFYVDSINKHSMSSSVRLYFRSEVVEYYCLYLHGNNRINYLYYHNSRTRERSDDFAPQIFRFNIGHSDVYVNNRLYVICTRLPHTLHASCCRVRARHLCCK